MPKPRKNPKEMMTIKVNRKKVIRYSLIALIVGITLGIGVPIALGFLAPVVPESRSIFIHDITTESRIIIFDRSTLEIQYNDTIDNINLTTHQALDLDIIYGIGANDSYLNDLYDLANGNITIQALIDRVVENTSYTAESSNLYIDMYPYAQFSFISYPYMDSLVADRQVYFELALGEIPAGISFLDQISFENRNPVIIQNFVYQLNFTYISLVDSLDYDAATVFLSTILASSYYEDDTPTTIFDFQDINFNQKSIIPENTIRTFVLKELVLRNTAGVYALERATYLIDGVEWIYSGLAKSDIVYLY